MSKQQSGSLRRRRVMGGSAAIAVAMGAALGGGSVTPQAMAAGSPSAPMTVWWTGTTFQAQVVQSLLQPWARAHHTTVTVQAISGSNFTTEIDTAIASGTLPNLCMLSQGYPDIYGIDHLAVDISKVDPALAKYIRANEPGGLAAGNVTFNKAVYGALEGTAPSITIVNQKVWQKYHLPAPTTWQVLSTKILPVLEAHGMQAALPNNEWQYWPVLYEYGGTIYAKNGTTVTFDSPAGVAALKAYMSPFLLYHQPTSLGPTQTMADLFQKGTYPLQVTFSGFIANLAAVPNLSPSDWAIEPYPAGPKGSFAWTGGTSLMAFNHSAAANREEMNLFSYLWSAGVQREITIRNYNAGETNASLFLTGNLASWKGLQLKGLTPADMSVLRESTAHSVSMNTGAKVTRQAIVGFGNAWQTVGGDFTKMLEKGTKLSDLAPLLKQAAQTTQSALNAVQ